MPKARATAIRNLAATLAAGDLHLDPGVDRDETRDRLLALPGIGPWTADYIAMRALGDPDVLLAGDLAVRNAAARLGAPSAQAELAARGAHWRPWRSYANVHLWASLSDHDKEDLK
jgi:AraC family transcriptional regulator of adaptative response / DNA-3-methyladenine glycosylase II